VPKHGGKPSSSFANPSRTGIPHEIDYTVVWGSKTVHS
jgi:hypothetical protein